jgi:lysophospholipase L1-like esterase
MYAQETRMRSTFQNIARKHHMPIVDATDALKLAASKARLHDPEDWNHLNKAGYTVLSEAILQKLEPLLAKMSKNTD